MLVAYHIGDGLPIIAIISYLKATILFYHLFQIKTIYALYIFM